MMILWPSFRPGRSLAKRTFLPAANRHKLFDAREAREWFRFVQKQVRDRFDEQSGKWTMEGRTYLEAALHKNGDCRRTPSLSKGLKPWCGRSMPNLPTQMYDVPFKQEAARVGHTSCNARKNGFGRYSTFQMVQ